MPPFTPLAEGFPPASEARWRSLAARPAIEGVASREGLRPDGMEIAPIYQPGDGPVLPMRPSGHTWTVVQRIDRGDAGAVRALAKDALRGGASGIELVFAASPVARGHGIDAEKAGRGIVTDMTAPLRLDAGEATPQLAAEAVASGREVVAAYDPIATMAARGGLARSLEGSLADIAALITKMDQAAVEGAAFIADGRPWNDAGASDLDELAIVLASAAGMLRLLAAQGIGGEQAARRLGIALSADAEQFPTIAKFRAVRLLFGHLFEVAGFGIPLPKVHGETAWRMMARREPTMNMIRATTAAFAAATGGADSITVLSPLLDGEAFSNRMARNTQLILQEESSLYRAADPGAGSGAIEALTNRLAAAAWDRFTGIEAKGGLIAVVQSGAIQRAVAATREARLEQVSRRQIPLVGVNVNVDRAAAVALDPDRIARESLGDEVEPLRATRLSERFEALCRRSLGKDGGRQRVVLVNLAHATGDALAVVADAFAAGGFAVEVADGRDAERAVAPDAPIACILTEAGSAEAANRVGQALRAAGARFVIAAGHHPEEPPSPPFDAVLSRDSDLIALFSEALDRIAAAQKNGQS